jgi:UDP-2-acetamido-2-deoxy-ribo-hexuluronate aminotransferase
MNSRLDTLQAAVLLAKLEVFEDELAARGRIARWYESRLRGQVKTPVLPEDSDSAWSVYSVLVDRRDEVRESLTAKGIATAIYYPLPLHAQAAYAAFGEGPGSRPVSERVSRRILALPMHPYLDEDTVETICRAVLQEVS